MLSRKKNKASRTRDCISSYLSQANSLFQIRTKKNQPTTTQTQPKIQYLLPTPNPNLPGISSSTLHTAGCLNRESGPTQTLFSLQIGREGSHQIETLWLIYLLYSVLWLPLSHHNRGCRHARKERAHSHGKHSQGLAAVGAPTSGKWERMRS